MSNETKFDTNNFSDMQAHNSIKTPVNRSKSPSRSRTVYKHIGKTVINGFELKLREVVLQGETYVVPEHITPVETKNKKGIVCCLRWQVRLTKPSKAFIDLDDAINHLSSIIVDNPPKRERKYHSKEYATKKFRTGAAGLYLQKKEHKGAEIDDIRLQLTFKMSTVYLYLGTLNTVSRERYKKAFVELFCLRKWLEIRTDNRDFEWQKKDKKIAPNLINEIPEEIRATGEKEALQVIEYEGFDEFVKNKAID